VNAFVSASHRIDAEVEGIAGRLSLEQTISAARWQTEAHLDSESHAITGGHKVEAKAK